MSARSLKVLIGLILCSAAAVALAAPTTATFELRGKAKAGKAVYVANCASCHGDTGKGDGPMAKTLRPPPTDFTNACFMAAVTDRELYTAVHDGGRAAGRGNQMTPWKERLNEQQIHDVVAYVKSLARVPRGTICEDPEQPTAPDLKQKKDGDKPTLCPRVATSR